MNCINLNSAITYIHPSIPQDQIIHCLADALIASFTPEEQATLHEKFRVTQDTNMRAVLLAWVNESLSQPDWQLAQRVLPLLLSRLESQLMIRRLDA